jgi:hypothetical protein
MLTHLSVAYCHHLSTIPSFPALICLTLTNNNILHEILPSPNLIKAEISTCAEDISGLARVEHLKVHSCCNLVSIPSLPNVKRLQINHCPKLSDLLQVTREWKVDIIQEKREVRLSNLPALNDLSFCQNIYFLQLDRLQQLNSCQGIGNIHHLKISSCKNLISTEGLGNVTGTFILL